MKKSAVTISDIARSLGVSEATVSLALNNNPIVKELSDRVSHSGYSLSIFISSNDPKKEERAIDDMISSRMEGMSRVSC